MVSYLKWIDPCPVLLRNLHAFCTGKVANGRVYVKNFEQVCTKWLVCYMRNIRSDVNRDQQRCCCLSVILVAPLHQARFSDYNQRMRCHCLSTFGGVHGDVTG